MAEKDFGQSYLGKVMRGTHDDLDSHGSKSVAEMPVKSAGGERVNRATKADKLPRGERQ